MLERAIEEGAAAGLTDWILLLLRREIPSGWIRMQMCWALVVWYACVGEVVIVAHL